jgi:hypothetical protein
MQNQVRLDIVDEPLKAESLNIAERAPSSAPDVMLISFA